MDKVLHIELDNKIGSALVNEMLTKFNINESFKNFIEIYSTLKFADDVEKREYVKNTLKVSFGPFFRSYNGTHYEESCEFVNAVCKIYFQYVTLKSEFLASDDQNN